MRTFITGRVVLKDEFTSNIESLLLGESSWKDLALKFEDLPLARVGSKGLSLDIRNNFILSGRKGSPFPMLEVSSRLCKPHVDGNILVFQSWYLHSDNTLDNLLLVLADVSTEFELNVCLEYDDEADEETEWYTLHNKSEEFLRAVRKGEILSAVL